MVMDVIVKIKRGFEWNQKMCKFCELEDDVLNSVRETKVISTNQNQSKCTKMLKIVSAKF
jgi:hypothetical protein